MTDEAVKNVSDDGLTQTINVRAGITRVGEVDVPNPVTLRPFRTFPEIEQPASQYVLRLRSGGKGGGPPECALFGVDSGLWEIEAIALIKSWLQERLPGFTVIA